MAVQLEKKQVTVMVEFWIGPRRYDSKGAAKAAVQGVLHGHPRGTELGGDEFDLVRDLLDMHPDAVDKIGDGVDTILIDKGPHPKYPQHPSFYVIRADEQRDDFSYLVCFNHPSLRSQVHNVMRIEIEDKTTAYFDSRITEGRFTSDRSGVPLQQSDTAVSYFRGPSFAQIADAFAANEGGWEAIELTPPARQGLGEFVDRNQAERWRAWWDERAVLALLTKQENRTRPRR
ncbi:DCL family protein [Streptomyces sp. NBC_00006]|uniref:DCL family protein n=1 Tax=Streptomyces sp. NBC_00006 TaxID=2975619 RepID=UPI002259B54A|nr:DCL family protein [Streptomyces sp. NBC_00006]MCX5537703.1 DCL family protein [Streptomyces sp. NBC_00006]MCX5537886.1 DCL family protein [Streptomyces sp. NBC_00006]